VLAEFGIGGPLPTVTNRHSRTICAAFLEQSVRISIRRSFANLSPRIRIHYQPAIPRGLSRGVVRARRLLSGLLADRSLLLTG